MPASIALMPFVSISSYPDSSDEFSDQVRVERRVFFKMFLHLFQRGRGRVFEIVAGRAAIWKIKKIRLLIRERAHYLAHGPLKTATWGL